MEKTEPTFVPEWLKNNGSLTTTSHQSSLHSEDQNASKFVRNKSLDNDLGRPTTSSFLRRPSSSNGPARSGSYSNFGRNRDRDKQKFQNRNRDFNNSDPLAHILPNRFERNELRRSQSSLSAKRAELWPKKIVSEKTGHKNGKITFERDFPSLDKQGDFEISSNVIQNLPVGKSGDVWNSVLAEVPVIVGNNGNNVSGQPAKISGNTSVVTGRNMAETLVQGPKNVQTDPQLSVGNQRLEELKVKQSRQLIPMTPSIPKTLADKPKLKVGQLQTQSSSLRPMLVKADVSKTPSSTVGKLHILKPSRERNSITTTATPTAKEIPAGGSKLPNCPPPAVVQSGPLRKTVEKRPSPQAKSRNDFFNLMRKKSMLNNSSSDSTNVEGGTQDCLVSVDKVDADVTDNNNINNNDDDGKKHRNSDVILLYSEEEEARFLRSLGWEEETTEEEEEGLTQEEINSFYRDVSKYVNLKTGSNFFKGTQRMALDLQMLKNAPGTKVDS